MHIHFDADLCNFVRLVSMSACFSNIHAIIYSGNTTHVLTQLTFGIMHFWISEDYTLFVLKQLGLMMCVPVARMFKYMSAA